MSRPLVRQILAIGSLVGLFLITFIYGYLTWKSIETQPLGIVFTGWLSITSSAVTFYFTDTST